MKNILGNVIRLFNTQTAPKSMRINILKSRKAISSALFSCKDTGKVIGIYSPALGEGMLLLGVDDVLTDHEEPVAIFKRYDLNGIVLPRTRIAVSEIRSACLFDCLYENPMLKKEAVMTN
jgi:hypothetical protein